MEKEKNTQWHPAFCSALKLELREDAEHLTYTNEYNINTKPLQMDMLIIKKTQLFRAIRKTASSKLSFCS